MSLIQEALRRQQEEMERSQEGGSGKTQADPPPDLPPSPPPEPPDSDTPMQQIPPIPDPPPDRRKKNESKSALPLLGMLVFIIVLLAAVAYLGWFIFDRFKHHIPESLAGSKEPPPAVVQQDVQPERGPEPEAEPKSMYGKMIRQAEGVVADTAERVDSTFDVEQPAPKPPAPPEKPVAAVERKPDPPKPAPPPVVKKEPAPAPPRVQKQPAKPLPPVDWPTLRVTGVLVSGKKGGGSALVNGRVVFVGQEINGATLLSVTGDGALFRCGHETNFFSTVSSF